MLKNAKVALVTGASQGIGRSRPLALARDGFDLVMNYRSHGDEAQQVVQDIKNLGGRALAIQADVGVRQEVENYYSEAEIQAGGARIPWGRLGTSDEIGTAVAFLCSPKADYITGSVLRIDGGLALRKS
ncbi:MAG: SDR family oxidoreductase [Chloroflexi bacterium]|nr:SDR family oxidoreductase [Chloroflexota bacterium]